MSKTLVRRAFKYRFYPTCAQAAELLRTFGCVRLVCNKALASRVEAWSRRQRRVTYGQTSAKLTERKRSEELTFPGEVSSVPLQQTLRHLQGAFGNFFAGRARHPRFKSRARTADRRRDVSGMLRRGRLARHISGASWSQL